MRYFEFAVTTARDTFTSSPATDPRDILLESVTIAADAMPHHYTARAVVLDLQPADMLNAIAATEDRIRAVSALPAHRLAASMRRPHGLFHRVDAHADRAGGVMARRQYPGQLITPINIAFRTALRVAAKTAAVELREAATDLTQGDVVDGIDATRAALLKAYRSRTTEDTEALGLEAAYLFGLAVGVSLGRGGGR